MGTNAVVLPGVIIAEGCSVGAMSLLKKVLKLGGYISEYLRLDLKNEKKIYLC
jgi:acetyltransferase-like isoleucine patch superfamily enzyme